MTQRAPAKEAKKRDPVNPGEAGEGPHRPLRAVPLGKGAAVTGEARATLVRGEAALVLLWLTRSIHERLGGPLYVGLLGRLPRLDCAT